MSVASGQWSGNTAPGETLWPDGTVELLFHEGARYTVGGNQLPHAFLKGTLTGVFPLATTGRVRLVGARLWTWGAYRLFGLPMAEVRDRALPLADLVGPEAVWLAERVLTAGTQAWIPILADWLTQRLHRIDLELHSAIIPLGKAILGGAGELTMNQILNESGLSLRQLERHFRTAVGLSPKRLQVIARFNGVRQALLFQPGADLLDLTYRFGYYDYAHLSREFKSFLGVTPHAFRLGIPSVPRPDVEFLQAEIGGPVLV